MLCVVEALRNDKMALPISTSYRLVASNLVNDAPHWNVQAARFLASGECNLSTPIAAGAASSSGTYCGETAMAAFCEILGGPTHAFSGTPQLAPSEWKGSPDADGLVWLKMDFAAPTEIGCVQLYQPSYARADTVTVEAFNATAGSWRAVRTAWSTESCASDACCNLASGSESFDASWGCDAVTSISLLPAPPPSPPPSAPPPLPPSAPPHPPGTQALVRVGATVALSGDALGLADEQALAQALASLLGIDAAQVDVTSAADGASLTVSVLGPDTASFRAAASEALGGGDDALGSSDDVLSLLPATANATSAALGAMQAVVVPAPDAPPSPPATPPATPPSPPPPLAGIESDEGGDAITGGDGEELDWALVGPLLGVGLAALAAGLFGALYVRRCRKASELALSNVNVLDRHVDQMAVQPPQQEHRQEPAGTLESIERV